jgi:hypothetical protein
MGKISFFYKASLLDGDYRTGLVIIHSPVMADASSGWWCEFEIEGMHKPWRVAGMSPLDAMLAATEMIRVIVSVRYADWSFTDERGDPLIIVTGDLLTDL